MSYFEKSAMEIYGTAPWYEPILVSLSMWLSMAFVFSSLIGTFDKAGMFLMISGVLIVLYYMALWPVKQRMNKRGGL